MTATSINPPLAVETAALDAVVVDIYRDIHKGIRGELFGVTSAAGAVDPGDHAAVGVVGARWGNLVKLLVTHAEHEERFVQPVIEQIAPSYAEQILVTHRELEDEMAQLEVLADRAADACAERSRKLTHRLYLGLASFTAAYLQHQEFEEFEVMVALSANVSPEELRAIDDAIVASIPPEEMAQSLMIMLPAMNIEDQFELISGARPNLPPDVYSALLATRLG
jgi:Hemerythrin HHE cation binding domain